MKKRVLVNIEVDPEKPPVWSFEDITLFPPPLAPRPPKYARVYTAAERKEKKAVKAFADPLLSGYGAGPWPFDYEKALVDKRYRAGVTNAMEADWTSQNWKFATESLLSLVYKELSFRRRQREGIESFQELWYRSFNRTQPNRTE